MMPRSQRALQALILAGLGLLLIEKLWSGTLTWYVSARLTVLVLPAAVGFLTLARTVLPAVRPTPELRRAAEQEVVPERHRLPTWRLLLVALPVIMALLVPAHSLGSRALASRGVNVLVPGVAAPGPGTPPAALPPQNRTVLDWVRAFEAAEDPGVFDGQPADVVGFVYHDPALAAGELIVSRFALPCCVAGAMGVGLLVRWPNAAALEGNAWVRVRGPVEPGVFNSQLIPVIAASGVEGVDEPQQPYLVP
jgi:putative membrane protein